jgi:hypothetical protein
MSSANAVAAMLLCAVISAAQVTTSTTPWTLNGSAKLQKLPDGGGFRLRLTPNQTGQAGSAFLSSPIAFGADYKFSYYFQFQMTDANFQASDGMTFILQTEGPTALGAGGGVWATRVPVPIVRRPMPAGSRPVLLWNSIRGRTVRLTSTITTWRS